MKLILNSAELDRQCREQYGLPTLLLMEEAGRLVAEAVLRRLRPVDPCLKRTSVVVLCGAGQNGGDGLVCARRLLLAGVHDVTVVLSRPETQLRGDTHTNVRILRAYPVSWLEPTDIINVTARLSEATVVVDALVGSGLTGELGGAEAALVEMLEVASDPRETPCPACVISIDVPSGVDTATGHIAGKAIKADMTVSLRPAKPGLFLFPGKRNVGQMELVDIGIPPMLTEQDPSPIWLLGDGEVAQRLPRRSANGHKYTFGQVLVVAGSRDMPGAAVLAAEAALVAGAGMVTLAAPESIKGLCPIRPEVIQYGLPENPEGALSTTAMEPLLRLLPRFDVVLLGPGLGRHLETVAFIGALLQELQEFQGTTVLDADALNGLSLLRDRGFGFHRGQEPAVAADAHQLVLGPRTILTPHGGECARLLATSRQAIEKNLIDSATQLSRTFGTQAVLKSASTVIANPDGQVWINPLGNSGMATAGSGDVLAGLIAGLAAQGASPADASAVGVYLHALAGDVAAELKTPYAMTAGDITACFSEAFARILKSDS